MNLHNIPNKMVDLNITIDYKGHTHFLQVANLPVQAILGNPANAALLLCLWEQWEIKSGLPITDSVVKTEFVMSSFERAAAKA